MAKRPESENPPPSAAPAAGTPDASAQPPAPPSAVADDPVTTLSAAEVMPEAFGRTDAPALELLFEACERFNVNPARDTRPRELASWRYYPGNRLEDLPASVVIVTSGGVKLTHFVGGVRQDPETEERLRTIFNAYVIDPKTRALVPAPLPTDHGLPETAVTGLVVSSAHRHQPGYLRRPRA